jgi:2-polyprenyl-3-methyl-5-hydroxy-6-metoxy-1,4-benzoquinol methylase
LKNFKNKFSVNYWLRKFFVSSFFQSLPIKNQKLRKIVFTSIYESNHWVQGDKVLDSSKISVSGHGSNIDTDQFFNLKKNILRFIENYEIKTLLDMPCGDFLWMNELIKNKKIDYLGVDIVDKMIEENKIKYGNENTNFLSADIVNFYTKKEFDLVIIRDLFIHIDNSSIMEIVNNIKEMNIKYLAFTNYNNKINSDVIIGRHRKINMLNEPFNMKEPIYKFQDYEKDKFIFFYKIEDL